MECRYWNQRAAFNFRSCQFRWIAPKCLWKWYKTIYRFLSYGKIGGDHSKRSKTLNSKPRRIQRKKNNSTIFPKRSLQFTNNKGKGGWWSPTSSTNMALKTIIIKFKTFLPKTIHAFCFVFCNMPCLFRLGAIMALHNNFSLETFVIIRSYKLLR